MHHYTGGTGCNTNCTTRLQLLCCGCCLGHGGAGRLVAAAIERRGLLPMYIDIVDGSQAQLCAALRLLATEEAGLDGGILSFSLSNLLYTENPYI